MSIKDDQRNCILRIFKCNKNYNKDINKELINRFPSTFKFCNGEFNKFLLLRKGVYPYEYMDNWERFNETSLPDKKYFYSSLNMEDITDIHYRHATRVFKIFSNKNISRYHDLHVQSDTLLLANAFESFRNICLKEYELDPAHLLSAPGLAWQACLKKTGIKFELLTALDMLLMIEKRIRGGITHAIQRFAKVNNKYMKNYDKNKESLYLIYLDAINLYGWVMFQNFPVEGFKWIYTSPIDKKFNKFIRLINNYDEESNEGYILEVDVDCPK